MCFIKLDLNRIVVATRFPGAEWAGNVINANLLSKGWFRFPWIASGDEDAPIVIHRQRAAYSLPRSRFPLVMSAVFIAHSPGADCSEAVAQGITKEASGRENHPQPRHTRAR